jgi:CRISPR-associated endonuclease/helicase Cas3
MSLLGLEGELGDHCRGVAKRAVHLAQHAGLPDDLTRAVEIAAQLHDVGKVDPRFQAWLHCGDEIAAALRVLAKSAINPRNRHLYQAAREASGLPAGWRHELLSVRLAETVCEDDLALRPIAAHHSGGRPFHTPVFELAPREITERAHAERTLTTVTQENWPSPRAAGHSSIEAVDNACGNRTTAFDGRVVS